jgi:hypothetical protein
MGVQLDASHTIDESEVREVTQVVSALAQNSDTAHKAREAYKNIANVIKTSARKFNIALENDEDLYNFITPKFIEAINNSKGDTIAKVLANSLSTDMKLPFSSQDLFVPFVKDIVTRINNDFITRHYSGTGAVLIPSHFIVQVYDILKEDNTYETITQKDLLVDALN